MLVKIAVEVNSKSEGIRYIIQAGIEKIIGLHQQVICEGLADGSLQVP